MSNPIGISSFIITTRVARDPFQTVGVDDPNDTYFTGKF